MQSCSEQTGQILLCAAHLCKERLIEKLSHCQTMTFSFYRCNYAVIKETDDKTVMFIENCTLCRKEFSFH